MRTVKIRFINCKCGAWEQMDSESPRHKSQQFRWLHNYSDGEAVYECPKCKSLVKSKIKSVEMEEER